MHCFVLREELYRRKPGVAKSLFKACVDIDELFVPIVTASE